ncbi:MAG: cbb3-type cytochrome c oxidase subunit 3 [Melioribacteraceae bacterium]|nr:cbb3-type cytochrome c oxidase subunit 3 [Melioribacteraceae bacterium]
MFSKYLSSIENVDIYPIITLLLFFSFFVLVIIWFFKADKDYLIKMGNMPLDLNEDNSNLLEKRNEDE